MKTAFPRSSDAEYPKLPRMSSERAVEIPVPLPQEIDTFQAFL